MSTITQLPLIDLRASFDNDKDILASILGMFMEEVPEDYELLKQHVKTGDYTAAGMQAHKVKSSYRTLGINDMASILQEIENRAKNNEDVHLINSLLEQFNQNYNQVNEQILYTKENL
ncbi:Hpt domain-containing protein [uncultured Nonlabens sp.]|uniref:Hpt domain-containing protein n=1 Tax=uncultured Nonlabens sp. TaxID=859306 RepID=UPI002614DC1E|nr:Hpt domain-containing protein [uncultured Nonlabens sp.]